MRVTIQRHEPRTFATAEEHNRYYGYLVVRPLATSAADILGRYRSRREAEQAVRQRFAGCDAEVMTDQALRRLSE